MESRLAQIEEICWHFGVPSERITDVAGLILRAQISATRRQRGRAGPPMVQLYAEEIESLKRRHHAFMKAISRK